MPGSGELFVRELGRLDSTDWARRLGRPAASVVTTEDELVPPHRQRQLAELVDARMFDLRADHLAVADRQDEFLALLLDALEHVGAPARSRPAGAARPAR